MFCRLHCAVAAGGKNVAISAAQQVKDSPNLNNRILKAMHLQTSAIQLL
jgi:hypothetical protein